MSVSELSRDATPGRLTMFKTRGKFLTVMIILGGLGCLTSARLGTNTATIQQLYAAGLPDWFFAYLDVGFLVSVITLLGLWMLRKWAAYLLAISMIVGVVVRAFFLPPMRLGHPFYAISLIAGGMSAAIWFWAISRKWQAFP